MKRILFCLLLASQLAAADTAIFAGGCFWCMEADFAKVHGVTDVISGYTGGHLKDPSYKAVSRGGTGHYEAVKIEYNPDQISYRELLAIFWRNIDPFDAQGQFCDKGDSYRSAIFARNEQQRTLAQQSVADLPLTLEQKRQIVTPILYAKTFYPAEQYHQDYAEKNSYRYRYYRWRCGRDARLEAIWGARAANP